MDFCRGYVHVNGYLGHDAGGFSHGHEYWHCSGRSVGDGVHGGYLARDIDAFNPLGYHDACCHAVGLGAGEDGAQVSLLEGLNIDGVGS